MGKKRRILNNPKFKGKRTRLWGEMNKTEQLSEKTEQVIEKLETISAPTPPLAIPAAKPKSKITKSAAPKRKAARSSTSKKTSKQ